MREQCQSFCLPYYTHQDECDMGVSRGSGSDDCLCVSHTEKKLPVTKAVAATQCSITAGQQQPLKGKNVPRDEPMPIVPAAAGAAAAAEVITASTQCDLEPAPQPDWPVSCGSCFRPPDQCICCAICHR